MLEGLISWIIAAVPMLQVVCTALVGTLSGVLLLATLIPGPEPERTLTKVLEFFKRISRK